MAILIPSKQTPAVSNNVKIWGVQEETKCFEGNMNDCVTNNSIWGKSQKAKSKRTVILETQCFNPIQDRFFRGYSRMGGGQKKAPLLKICHTYPAMMKLCTLTPYLRKIKKIYKSRDTPLEFC